MTQTERAGRRHRRPEIADKVGKVWGLGSDTTKDPGPRDGEQRNMRAEGVPTPVYGLQEVHHTS